MIYAGLELEQLDRILNIFLNGSYILLLGLLPYAALAFFMQIISNSLRNEFAGSRWRKVFIYFTAPGVIIHELGHVIFCFIFNHEILSIKLFSPDGNNSLGYVNHRYDPKNFYHRTGNFFIGTGPVWFGIIMLFLFSRLLLPDGMISHGENVKELLERFFSYFLTSSFWTSWQTWLWFYLSFCITAHITLSKSDLKGAKEGFFLVLILFFLLSFVLGWCEKWKEQFLKFEIQVLAALLAMMITIIIVLVLPGTILHLALKHLKKKSIPIDKE